VEVHPCREAGRREQREACGGAAAEERARTDRHRGWKHRAAAPDSKACERREQEQEQYG
jgi:hypothetical protein